MPFGIAGVARYLPPGRATVADVAREQSMPPEERHLLSAVHGLEQCSVAVGETLGEMMIAAIRQALAEAALAPADVRTVMYCHTFHHWSPPLSGMLPEVISAAGLQRARWFAVYQQNCASFFMALRLARNLLQRRPEEGPVLIVTGDRVPSAKLRTIPYTTLMADGAAACLVVPNPAHDRVVTVANLVEGAFYRGLGCDPDDNKRFELVYLMRLRQVLERGLTQAGTTWKDMDLILPHNVNLTTWRRLTTMLGLPMDRVFTENIPRLAHSFCSDALINYVDAKQAGRLRPGQLYMMVGVGLGASYGCCILRH